MRNKYLLLGAASALMLAACSEDIKGPENNNKPVENALNLTSLSPASQAGRVSLPGQTRGLKANRLQLVATIAPIGDAANNVWSATGVAIANGNAYISWHSDRQANTPAKVWGGGLDVINISALDGLKGAVNPENVITNTLTSTDVKFNNVVANGSDLYFPLTCPRSGAAVGHLAIGSETMDTIRIPGSTANAIEVKNGTLYAVSGYRGGVYSMDANFAQNRQLTEEIAVRDDFGGKYIVDGQVLRTDAESSAIESLDGTSRSLGAPLTSQEKDAESYDPETGTWNTETGNVAAYYGKHNMAISDGYIYVAGGIGAAEKNGLRVYGASGETPVWQNGTTTTSVFVEGDFVYAATAAGLRVYKKAEGGKLEVFAFEVLNYNSDGSAAAGPDSNSPVAGTNAHSCNFVAVGGGYIFVATGQTGVSIFKLVDFNETGFKTTIPGVENTQEVKEGETANIKAPEAPGVESWKDEEGNEYVPGTEYPVEGGTVIVLDPVYKAFTVNYDLNGGEGTVPTDQKVTYNETPEWPADPTKANHTFGGWSVDGETPVGKDYKVTEDVTFTALWNENQKYSYTVSFDLENANGTKPADIPVEGYTSTLEFDAFPAQGNISKGEGFKFVGWSDKPNNKQSDTTPVYNAGDKYPVSGNVTFYPVWEIKQSGGSTPDVPGIG